jgi:hypothetical protein
MYKETDLTNIKCDKCQTPIAYETVSFIGACNGTCIVGNYHPKQYAVKCSKCKKGYGPWKDFNISLFPNFPDPDKCTCKNLCNYCGFNVRSEKCCGRNRNKNTHLLRQGNDFDDDLYRLCLKCGKWDRMCDGSCVKSDGESTVESDPVVKRDPVVKDEAKEEWIPINKRKYGIFSLDDIMKIILKPLKDYSNEPVNMFAYPSKFEPIDKLNLKALEYPFSFINDNVIYYKPSEICTGLVNEEPIDVGDFPNNIVEYYWIHEGTNDEENWHLFCKVTTKEGEEAYVYYTAGCDYTGFDCQGDMKIYISRNAPALLDSLDKVIQDKLIRAKGICTRKNSTE